MKRSHVVVVSIGVLAFIASAMNSGTGDSPYLATYVDRLNNFKQREVELLRTIGESDLGTATGRAAVEERLSEARLEMKGLDLWLRYLEPLAEKRINGPLPVEWETDVLNKLKKPDRRAGAGLTLAAVYLDEPGFRKDSLLQLVQAAIDATDFFASAEVKGRLAEPQHFFLCNRLFLLNLAAIYTTAFECPDTSRVIPELRSMLTAVGATYRAFNASFPSTRLSEDYLTRFDNAIAFANAQPEAFTAFDHFAFLRDHVNPLFGLNQQFIVDYHAVGTGVMDVTLNGTSRSIFDKAVYRAQEAKGIYAGVEDPATLARIDALGRQLFFDPVLSGNNERSCASCHKPDQFFVDTTVTTATSFDHQGVLPRNTPSLVNVTMNHLIMLDGRHPTLQDQARAVIAEPKEMSCAHDEALRRVMSCPDYRSELRTLLASTPQVKEVGMEHVVSAITYYYGKFSAYRSPFDEAMDANGTISVDAQDGFNLFMGKALCATCHFVPQFNGVKPPFIGSEFEVLGTPEDSTGTAVSDDLGRYVANPAPETHRAFRTGSLRNIQHTAPYMHNGCFKTLAQVIDFYDAGGGAGRGLDVPNQTLSSDSLHLSPREKQQLTAFLNSLTEAVPVETVPATLAHSKSKDLNARKPGGVY